LHYPKVNRSVSIPNTGFFRARNRRSAARLILPIAATALSLAVIWAAAPTPLSAKSVTSVAAGSSSTKVVGEPPTLALPIEAPATVEPTVEAVVEPAVEVVAEPLPAQAASWSIGITSFGWQTELDACQWVLMDMTADVPLPIVAAHNYCGGGIVLEMGVGDTVTLSGYGLDGTYAVVGDRDAWAGSNAAEAIAGMAGDVVLQTCYWDDDGTERLVSLQRVA
jgi:hypothetical protein